MRGRILIAAIFLGLSPPVMAESTVDFMGLTMGAPLTAAECPIKKIGTMAVYDSPPRSVLPCWQRFGYADPIGPSPDISRDGVVWLQVDGSKYPPGISWKLTVCIKNGNIVGILADTSGADRQEMLLALLSKKYGPPTTSEVEAMQNAFGATFNGISASWVKGDVTIALEGIANQMDSGYITVMTEAGTKLFNDAVEKLRNPSGASF